MSWTKIRGATDASLDSSTLPLFDQKGDDEVTIKSIYILYLWDIANITDSQTHIADDLMAQLKTDIDN